MKRTKFTLLSILTILILLLSACAQATQAPLQEPSPTQAQAEPAVIEPPASTEPQAEPQPADTEPAIEESVGEVVELIYMRQAEGSQAELDLVEKFNQSHPNIHVTVDSVPAEDNYPKLVLTTEANTPPDIYMTYFTLGAATNGLALDLTPYVEKEGEEWFNSLSENGWVFHEYAGSYYAVPWRVAPSMVILNNNLLAKAELEPPPNDWTWEDFTDYAVAMTDPDAGEYGFCIMGSAEDPGTDYQFYPFLFQANGKTIGEDGMAGFNSPEGAEALQYMVDLIHTYKVVPPATTSATANACIDLLAADKAGMWTNASLWLGIIRGSYPGADITIAPMPSNEIGAGLIGGTGFGISPKSKDPDAAWEFVKFMVSDESMREWSSAFFFTPPNVSIMEDEEFLSDPEQAAVAYAMLEQKMYPLAHYPDSSNLESALRNYIQAAYLQDMTPEDALAAAAVEWDAVLQDYVDDNWWDAWIR